MYILSLDIKKAFPSVRLDQVPVILKHRGVPSQLINRLVTAVLRTRISLVWFCQKTRYFEKTRGIKEGCPVSPQIFNLIIDEVVQTLKEILQETYQIDLDLFENRQGTMRAPFLMAFADDILLVCEDLSTLEVIYKELLDLLSSLDLKINESKTKLMIRDPGPEEYPNQFRIAGMDLDRVQSLKYLGSTISSTTNRPATTRVRNYSALAVYKKLLPSLAKLKAPFALLRTIYSTVLLPILMYGLNITSLTKANRLSLSRKEILMIHGLASIAYPRPTGTTAKILLRGKTINRRISAQRIRYYSHILRRPTHSILRRAMDLSS